MDVLLGRGTRAPQPPGPFLPPDTPIILGERGTTSVGDDERIRAILAFLSDPDKARRCAETQLIETPDFQSADEPAVRTKTRGASAPVVRACVSQQDDTSDEAYEQLHSKFERAEKRLRRLEKEGLVRDRRHMVEQVARLETMDVHKLLPALEAREAELSGTERRPREAILACAQHMQQELLADARETLARYDKLLPDHARGDRPPSKRPLPHPSVEPRRSRGEQRQARARRAEDSDAGSAGATGRTGPSLAALAVPAAEDAARSHGARNSARTRATSAFGERLPDYVARRAAFDDTMAPWIEAAAAERCP
ncbi:unnamed protein product [Malassezia sympodialis ATCC 42132]|uniref:uncharacterized protein n=1 Tax=Malassezia sympodialis (strain ATCC 42132) TaxID=1230383 RepID=UPI0002C2328A|nr:uncharacterized protein MSY001_1537 [Malassezia sympodialis ATCC 42132]CCU98831.1 unnamed protein product [Malassezia sympodialis ATCC 42132]|eukprot:XP_018740112.1 uncharacterized protein MSY001_1537 [Malassezia sympodialis ATCC 42132]